jgi:Tol biopolymer transport system component
VGVALLAVCSAAPTAQTASPAPQTPPATEIYLAPFEEGEGRTTRILFLGFSSVGVSVGKPINITNNPGYDNQPFFLPDSSALLFSSNRDGKQTDIYRYDIAARAVSQVTRTPDNEYSPTVTPDGRTFSTVRGAEQRLWRFGLDGSDAGLAWAHRGLIGYHAWMSPYQIAAFILGARGSANTLELMDLRTGTSEVITTNIGRSLHVRPGRGTLTFVHKTPDPWAISELDPKTRKIAVITPTVEGSEDLTWTPVGTAVMGAKSKLFIWRASEDRWIEVADLRKSGVVDITRLAVSPDGKWIAIVSTPAQK